MKILKPVFVTLLCCVVALGFRAGLRRFFPRLYASTWGVSPRGDTNAVKTDIPAAGSSTRVSSEEKTAIAARSTVPKEKDEQPLYATGRMISNSGRVIVQMSDGSVRTENDNREIDPKKSLSRVTSTYADIDGKRYWFRGREREKAVGDEGRDAARPLLPLNSDPASVTSGFAEVGRSPERSEDAARSREAKASSDERQAAAASQGTPPLLGPSAMSRYDSLPPRRQQMAPAPTRRASFYP